MRASERRAVHETPVILIVDDESDIRELLELTIIRMGLRVEAASSVATAKARVEAGEFALCLTDMRLPDGDGLEIVRHIVTERPNIPVAVITAFSSAENAVAALKAGAFDYVSKPISLEQLKALVKTALKLPREQGEDLSQGSPHKRGEAAALDLLLGESALMQQTRRTIEKLARSQAPIYITGESGSGKELAARLVHRLGARTDGPWVAVNCGAIPENLMESEFFGHKKGSFTGAHQDKEGIFQAARGGTLFLDEVAELPLSMQVKLLRAIQEKRVRKIGSPHEEAADVRIISASHHDLAEGVKDGRFRQDLYYRLNVIELRMPALREIAEDIPVLAQAILARIGEELGAAPPRLTSGAVKALQVYEFVGNVRELENILERAVALAPEDLIRAEDLQLTPRTEAPDAERLKGLPLPEYLDALERQAILEALGKTRFNRTAASRLLGISFRALRYRMERLGIR